MMEQIMEPKPQPGRAWSALGGSLPRPVPLVPGYLPSNNLQEVSTLLTSKATWAYLNDQIIDP